MRRVVIAAVSVSICVTCLWGTSQAQISTEQRDYPNPLYSGIGSQAAQPVKQSQYPLYFFEGKVNWPDLQKRIPGGQPRTAWEYAQRAMYEQDDLHDLTSAIADYKTSESMNDRVQIVQARMAVISLEAGIEKQQGGDNAGALAAFEDAIARFQRVLDEAPERQGLHFNMAEAYEHEHDVYVQMADPAKAAQAWVNAEREYNNELSLAPGSQRAHLGLAELLIAEGKNADAVNHLNVYLCQSELHSDPYPFKILKARAERDQLTKGVPLDCAQVGSATP